jgi:ribosomal protein L37AE/L43A
VRVDAQARRPKYVWVCPICGKTIATPSKVRTLFEANHHLAWHHDVDEKASPHDVKVVRE